MKNFDLNIIGLSSLRVEDLISTNGGGSVEKTLNPIDQLLQDLENIRTGHVPGGQL